MYIGIFFGIILIVFLVTLFLMKIFVSNNILEKIKQNVYAKWTVLVLMNVFVSFVISFVTLSSFGLIAHVPVILGIITFIIIYAELDKYLVKIKKIDLRKALVLGAFIKIFTQFYPMLEMISGAISLEFMSFFFGGKLNIMSDLDSSFEIKDFFYIYFVTIFDGILLSILVGILTLIFKFFLGRKNKFIERISNKLLKSFCIIISSIFILALVVLFFLNFFEGN